MDFWPQHKDFVLRVLAGFGVFLVALIARGITYGDDLEQAQAKNASLAGNLEKMRLMKAEDIVALEEAARKLQSNVVTLAGQIGWNVEQGDVRLAMVQKTLDHLSDKSLLASDYIAAIDGDLNAGFGELKAKVRDSLLEEADEVNITVAEGLGFEVITEMQAPDLLKYLAQLELAARCLRLAIKGGVTAFNEIRIETGDPVAVPGANPDFLREYVVRFEVRGSPASAVSILNGLETSTGTVPLRGLDWRRVTRGRSTHLIDARFEVAATLVRPSLAFKNPESKP